MNEQRATPTIWKRLKKWVRRLCLIAVSLVAIVALFGAIWARRASQQFYEQNPMPGKLVDVGQHKLHTVVMGSGPVNVIFDAGGGVGGTYSHPAATEVARFARVCLFDRAGLGWSEAGSLPRTPQRLVEEQRALLKELGLKPPYVLVGTSYGGALARLFACMHREEIAGLVLVDPLNVETATVEELDSQVGVLHVMDTFRNVGYLQLLDELGALPEAREFESDEVNRASRMERDFWTIPKHFHTFVNEIRAADVGLADAKERTTHLGDLPVTVILPDKYDGFIFADSWKRGQEKIQSASDDVQVVTLEGGHGVNYERPDLVVRAVKEMLERIKER